MPDRPILPEPTGDQGEAQFRADLVAYLNSLFLHELGELLGELPEPTRVALMHELSERGPAWASRGNAAPPTKHRPTSLSTTAADDDRGPIPCPAAGHLLGDWVTQTDWQAANKSRSWAALAGQVDGKPMFLY